MRLRIHARLERVALLASLVGAAALAVAAPGALAASTTTTLEAAPQSPVWGQAVTVTATVEDVSDTPAVPTGSVEFTLDGAPAATVDLVDGTASISSSTLEVGSHTVQAHFTGTGGFTNSDSDPLTGTVAKAKVTVVETASPNPAVAGQQIVFAASVKTAPPSSAPPTGQVQFLRSDRSPLGGLQDLKDGPPSFAGFAGAGRVRVFASYLGDTHFEPFEASVDMTVNKADTATALTAAATRIAPGQSFVVTAMVSVKPPGHVAKFGSLQFTVNGTPAGKPFPLEGADGVQVEMTPPSVPASYTLGVVYSGDANTNASTAAPLRLTVGAAGGGASMASQLRAAGTTLVQALRKKGLAALRSTPEPFAAPTAGVLRQEVDSPNPLKAAKSVRLASARRAFKRPGSGVLKLRLTAAGRRAIRQGRTLRLAIVTQFTPKGGTPTRVIQRVTVTTKKGTKTVAPGSGWSLSGVTRIGPKTAQLNGQS